jgi:hypothetical protein
MVLVYLYLDPMYLNPTTFCLSDLDPTGLHTALWGCRIRHCLPHLLWREHPVSHSGAYNTNTPQKCAQLTPFFFCAVSLQISHLPGGVGLEGRGER